MTGSASSKAASVAAEHDGQHAVLGAGLATGDRRIEETGSPALAAAASSSRATSAEAVVLSIKIAPLLHPAKAPSAPIVTERRSSSLPTQEKTKSWPSAAACGVGAVLPPICSTHSRPWPRCGCRQSRRGHPFL